MTEWNRGEQSSQLSGRAARASTIVFAGLITWLGMIAVAGFVSAEPAADESPDSQWRTSIAISLKAQQQRAEGTLSSTLATTEESGVPIPLDAKNHDDYFVPIIPIELGIQTPSFSLPATNLEPRVFFLAGYQFIPITERDFLVAGKFVTLPANPTPSSQGLGGEIRIDLQHQWSVSVGMAFPFEIADISFEVRPSLDYMGQWMRADATVIGIEIATGDLLKLASDESKAFHYLGPRLSLETDAGTVGDSRMVFFMEGSAYFSRFAGQQQLRGRDTSGVESAQYEYKPDQLLFQIGVGFRAYWNP